MGWYAADEIPKPAMLKGDVRMDPGFPRSHQAISGNFLNLSGEIHDTMAIAELLSKSRGMAGQEGGVSTEHGPLQKTATQLTPLPAPLPFASTVLLLTLMVHKTGKAGNITAFVWM